MSTGWINDHTSLPRTRARSTHHRYSPFTLRKPRSPLILKVFTSQRLLLFGWWEISAFWPTIGCFIPWIYMPDNGLDLFEWWFKIKKCSLSWWHIRNISISLWSYHTQYGAWLLFPSSYQLQIDSIHLNALNWYFHEKFCHGLLGIYSTWHCSNPNSIIEDFNPRTGLNMSVFIRHSSQMS